MAPVLAAIITLIGTLVIGALGFWQWRRTQSVSERKEYRAERIETLRILWEALNEIEEANRTHVLGKSEQLQQGQVRKVNLLLMKSAPFLLDDEREWSISIVQSIIEIDTAIRVGVAQKEAGAEWWGNTAAQAPGEDVVAIAASHLYTLREALASRYAAVMRGEHD